MAEKTSHAIELSSVISTILGEISLVPHLDFPFLAMPEMLTFVYKYDEIADTEQFQIKTSFPAYPKMLVRLFQIKTSLPAYPKMLLRFYL